MSNTRFFFPPSRVSCSSHCGNPPSLHLAPLVFQDPPPDRGIGIFSSFRGLRHWSLILSYVWSYFSSSPIGGIGFNRICSSPFRAMLLGLVGIFSPEAGPSPCWPINGPFSRFPLAEALLHPERPSPGIHGLTSAPFSFLGSSFVFQIRFAEISLAFFLIFFSI